MAARQHPAVRWSSRRRHGDGAEALSQTQIAIDLAPGYDGRLVVNSVEIPDEDVDKDSNLNQIVFVPDEGKAVEELPSGQETCVLALYWPLAEGEGGAGSGSTGGASTSLETLQFRGDGRRPSRR